MTTLINYKKTNQDQKNKKLFEDVVCGEMYFPSDWKRMKASVKKKTVECQTGDELYNLQEAEVQTGRYTNVYQSQVETVSQGTTLIEYVNNNQTKFSSSGKKKGSQYFPVDFQQQISDGFFTVDCEVETDPSTRIEADNFIEYVDVKKHISTQTEKVHTYLPSRSSGEEKGEGKDDEAADTQSQFKEYAPVTQPKSLLAFLDRATPLVLKALVNNQSNKAFDYLKYDSETLPGAQQADENAEDGLNANKLWKYLTVDFEKKKILFPDWSKAKHIPGIITKVTVTRNKERLYDVEYDDGFKYAGVREEYIRLLENGGSKSSSSASSSAQIANKKRNNPSNARLFEGLRVHCKVQASSKSGGTKYYLGRIMKINKQSYDIEILENSRVENNVPLEDLIIGGLPEGSNVEARRPAKTILQTTSVSWNANGSMVGITYGKNDIEGWCDLPGVLCCWNIFSKSFHYQKPDYLIDHSSCLMALKFHPVIPSIVAVASYNGEIILYDLLTYVDKPLAISNVSEYGHKEPIVDLKWIKNTRYTETASSSSSSESNMNDLESWYIVSCGSDGKILFWSIMNKLQFPIKGYLLSKGKVSRRQYPIASGASSFTFSCPCYLMNNNNNSSQKNQLFQFTPKWMMIGETSGEIIRCQVSRLPNQIINPESLKSLPTMDEVFPSLKKKEEPFGHQAHIGAVTCMDWSPFQRNLFITGGVDGTVKLFHIFEQTPIMKWEPASSHLQDSVHFTSITSVHFSPHRPMVFACSTNEGFIYIFDLVENPKLPVAILEANEKFVSTLSPQQLAAQPNEESSLLNNNNNGTNASEKNTRSKQKGIENYENKKNSILDFAFNHKQRDLIAASDYYGKVFIWKLNWKLSNRSRNENDLLSGLANIFNNNNENGNNQQEK